MLIRPSRRAGVSSYPVFAEQPQVVERDRQHLIAIVIALVNLGRAAFVLVERLFLRLLRVELSSAGKELLLVERNFLLRLLLLIELDLLEPFGEVGRFFDPLRRVFLQRAD